MVNGWKNSLRPGLKKCLIVELGGVDTKWLCSIIQQRVIFKSSWILIMRYTKFSKFSLIRIFMLYFFYFNILIVSKYQLIRIKLQMHKSQNSQFTLSKLVGEFYHFKLFLSYEIYYREYNETTTFLLCIEDSF